MPGIGEPADKRDRTAAGEMDRKQRQNRRHGIKEADAELRILAEQPRGRADADDRVVARVLHRVDRVVADRPAEGGEIEKDRRQGEAREGRAPAHQRPPRKGEAEDRLRPGRDPLHQRIDRNDCERDDAEPDRKQVEVDKHRKPDQRLGGQEYGRRADADPARRQRAPACALDFRIELAVQNVVIGRARAAHRDRADEEEREMPEIGPALEREPRQRRRLPAGRQQQLPAGGPVEPGELDEGKREIRREAQDEARRPRVRQNRRAFRLDRQSGPAGSGWACGPPPPPCAACSFIFLIFSATVQALALNPWFLAWLVLRLLIASSGNEHQSLFFSI